MAPQSTWVPGRCSAQCRAPLRLIWPLSSEATATKNVPLAAVQVAYTVRIPMSAYQNVMYEWVQSTGTLRRDPDEHRVGKSTLPFVPLNNKAMELRKVGQHLHPMTVARDHAVHECWRCCTGTPPIGRLVWQSGALQSFLLSRGMPVRMGLALCMAVSVSHPLWPQVASVWIASLGTSAAL